MRYNGTCSAGVAHLAERHLAKVEVASSNLVARSRQTHLLRQVGFCHPGGSVYGAAPLCAYWMLRGEKN